MLGGVQAIPTRTGGPGGQFQQCADSDQERSGVRGSRGTHSTTVRRVGDHGPRPYLHAGRDDVSGADAGAARGADVGFAASQRVRGVAASLQPSDRAVAHGVLRATAAGGGRGLSSGGAGPGQRSLARPSAVPHRRHQFLDARHARTASAVRTAWPAEAGLRFSHRTFAHPIRRRYRIRAIDDRVAVANARPGPRCRQPRCPETRRYSRGRPGLRFVRAPGPV